MPQREIPGEVPAAADAGRVDAVGVDVVVPAHPTQRRKRRVAFAHGERIPVVRPRLARSEDEHAESLRRLAPHGLDVLARAAGAVEREEQRRRLRRIPAVRNVAAVLGGLRPFVGTNEGDERDRPRPFVDRHVLLRGKLDRSGVPQRDVGSIDGLGQPARELRDLVLARDDGREQADERSDHDPTLAARISRVSRMRVPRRFIDGRSTRPMRSRRSRRVRRRRPPGTRRSRAAVAGPRPRAARRTERVRACATP